MCRRLCIRQLSVSMMLYVERDAPGAESCRELDGEKFAPFLKIPHQWDASKHEFGLSLLHSENE